MAQLLEPERPPQNFITPFGRRSWTLPCFPLLKVSLLGEDEPWKEPYMEVCEIRRGIYSNEDKKHPRNPDATIHICPHHFVIIYWVPKEAH